MSPLEQLFWQFANTVLVPSKDHGLTPFKPYGTQRYLIHELFQAIEEDKREVFVLKSRQIGATTVLAIFDAFWMQVHKGLQGHFIADSEANLQFFRSVLTETIKSAPRKFRHPIISNNKTQLLWGGNCQSRLLFQTASAKNLGRGRGIAYLHSTETAFYNNLEVIGALRAAFSEKHPSRLYIWETTANGFNEFHKLYKDAERATTLKAIFIPWWRHEQRVLDPQSQAFKVYWDGRLTADEQAWQRDIERRYGVSLTAEQWAWYRYTLSEKMSENEILMMQEHPTLPEHAFQATGQPFIGYAAQQKLREDADRAEEPESYAYDFGGFIEDTQIYETDKARCQLLVWEKADRNSHYVVSADPAYGASENSDQSVCQVWRATKTKLIQVAEFASNQVTMTQFAWVIAHLCGSYSPNAYLILETNGPGMGVLQELDRLKNYGFGTTRRAELENFLQAVSNYLWVRPDSRAGIGNSYHWRTDPRTKVWIINRLRDQLINGHIIARSRAFVEELGHVRQSGEKFSTEGSGNDDRVIAAALAVEDWSYMVLPILETLPPSPEEQSLMQNKTLSAPQGAAQESVRQFFQRLGLNNT